MDTTRFDHEDEVAAAIALLVDDPGDAPDAAALELLPALHQLKALVDGKILAANDVFERRKLAAADGARSTAGWAAARVDQTRGRCGADVTLARRLRDTPAVRAACHTGRLGRVKVELLVEARTAEVAEVFAEQEAWLVQEVAGLRVDDARRFLQAWHQAARLLVGSVDPDEPVVDAAPRAAVSLTQTFAGRYVLDGEMDAEEGAIVRNAIDAEVDELFRVGVFTADDGLSPAERRGHALVQIVSRKGHVGMKHGRPRPSVEVICDEHTLLGEPVDDEDDLQQRVCALVDGTPLPPASLHRLLCGADVHRLVISAAGEVLDAGKDIRLANRAQRRALRFRHARHCAFPGCDAPIDWCEAHHIEEFDPDPASARGRSDMANLVPLCRFHHHRVHEGGFSLVLEPDGTVVAHRPPGPGGARCRVSPARRWRKPIEPHPDTLLVRQRVRALVGASPAPPGSP